MILDAEEWRISASLDWKPKNPAKQITCPYCNGKGETGGGFKDLDGPVDCWQCNGMKYIWKGGPESQKPDIPQELIDHMRKAFEDFVMANSD